MAQKDKKQKGARKNNVGKRTGKILEIIEIAYKAKVQCWCGEILTIDSSKSTTENECPQCNSSYKLVDAEWTHEEMKKYADLKGVKL